MLLDTNALLWLEGAPDRLSEDARRAISDWANKGEKIAISAISLWEIALLAQRKRIALSTPVEHFLKRVEESYLVLPITIRVAVQAAELPAQFPKDPMDRLIAATAMVANRTLISADRSIRESAVCKVIW
jgi:PIN domain nuclease of toxin-antitoxin system